MSKAIYCDKCINEIKVRDDLVTATYVFVVVPYHEECYAKDLKGAKTFFLDNQPLNGFSGNLFFLFSIILAIIWCFIAEPSLKWLSLFAITPIGYRLYSYLIYERHIEK
ncbi:hypothetical protein BN1058_00056 [Paraliobacillus sp. PM-2]|uniref:hypothetical protein n=1 Tax=Paraliobacillus sp. PM-2 TaxID=1462524 RepID=UPI00061C01F4|nr:hypothetical protein [Paraliobacillus sp. PM-2]CQR45818.1 hypothetical protein BN1058_00056 [Paraliobacillus sp. PM-2]